MLKQKKQIMKKHYLKRKLRVTTFLLRRKLYTSLMKKPKVPDVLKWDYYAMYYLS